MFEVDAVLAEIDAQDTHSSLFTTKWISPVKNRIWIMRKSMKAAIRRGFGIWSSDEYGLLLAISRLLAKQVIDTTLDLAPHQGQMRALLFDHGAVVSESVVEDGNFRLHVRIEPNSLKRLHKDQEDFTTARVNEYFQEELVAKHVRVCDFRFSFTVKPVDLVRKVIIRPSAATERKHYIGELKWRGMSQVW